MDKQTCYFRRCHRHGMPATWGIDSPDLLWEALLRAMIWSPRFPPTAGTLTSTTTPIPGCPVGRCRRWGAFLDNVGGFDSEFFGIAEREATAIDPQHRLLLETSWEAMEHAGLTRDAMAGSLTGVFVGLTHDDYHLLAAETRVRGGAVWLYRQQLQHGVRAGRVRHGAPWSGGHGGHCMLFRPERHPPGLSQPD